MWGAIGLRTDTSSSALSLSLDAPKIMGEIRDF
jgi:hypothetical protein